MVTVPAIVSRETLTLRSQPTMVGWGPSVFSGLVFLLRCRYRAASRASVPASHFLKSLYAAFRLANELLWDLLRVL